MNLAGLKKERGLIGRIDWEMTPQEAFQAYQIKSPGGWKQRNLADVLYFQITVDQGSARLVLVQKTMKDSREVAEIEAPAELIAACLPTKEDKPPPHGHYPPDQRLKTWLRAELEA